jgi:nucleotide-binding universal stress UspA family protein
MYRHILVPTDGSELANRAVVHGLSLAKSVGAKITAVVVEPTFNVYDVPSSRMFRMTDAFAKYSEHAKAHAARILTDVADAAKSSDVPCETMQMIHDHPYEAIVTTIAQY